MIDAEANFGAPVEWLQYLLDHFLRRGALAEASRRSEFEAFTFNHSLSGAVAMYRADTGELSLIGVEDGHVFQSIVVAGEDTSRI
ncbi:MAG TPA: hypothetical protein VHD81_05270 [Mycobacteriales bacterium]|nr:hypothetical protein [Mycobacteriales bacterium]